MDTQDFNKELLDYLYDEMSTEERKAFESKMAEDTGLRREFDELNSIRQELNQLKDKEVMEPFSALGKSGPGSWMGASKKGMIVFRPVTAVAAFLLLLMLVGYLTNFSLSINNQGVFIGYGEQNQSSQEHYMRESDIRDLVQLEVRRNNEILLSKLNESQYTVDNKLASLEASVDQAIYSKKNTSIASDELEKFITEAENTNKELMNEYLKVATAQQQDYFKAVLTQFNEFIQEQRNEDLTLIRNSLIDIKQSQNVQKLETDQAIASLLTSVSQRSN